MNLNLIHRVPVSFATRRILAVRRTRPTERLGRAHCLRFVCVRLQVEKWRKAENRKNEWTITIYSRCLTCNNKYAKNMWYRSLSKSRTLLGSRNWIDNFCRHLYNLMKILTAFRCFCKAKCEHWARDGERLNLELIMCDNNNKYLLGITLCMKLYRFFSPSNNVLDGNYSRFNRFSVSSKACL